MIIREWKYAGACLLAGTLGLAMSVSAHADEEYWLQDPITNCSLWTHQRPGADEMASWSGGCEQGRASGSGVLSWFREQRLWGRYQGNMVAGKVSGYGDLWLYENSDDGAGYDHYTGMFEGGGLSGQVVLERSNGDRFEGGMRDGRMEGYGIYVAANGDRYDGEFHLGLPEGQGYSVSAAGEHYRGHFRAGERAGEGTLLELSGDRYIGMFEHGVARGQGRFEATDGGVYVGEFSAGKPHGRGVYTAADGRVYDGAFATGRPQGTIRVSLPGGEVSEQRWHLGERLDGEQGQ